MSLTVNLPPYVRDLKCDLEEKPYKATSVDACVIKIRTERGLAWLTLDPWTARELAAGLIAAGFAPAPEKKS